MLSRNTTLSWLRARRQFPVVTAAALGNTGGNTRGDLATLILGPSACVSIRQYGNRSTWRGLLKGEQNVETELDEEDNYVVRAVTNRRADGPRLVRVHRDLYPRPSPATIELDAVDEKTGENLVDDEDDAASYVKLLTVPYVPECEGRVVKHLQEISDDEEGFIPPSRSLNIAVTSPLKFLYQQLIKHVWNRLVGRKTIPVAETSAVMPLRSTQQQHIPSSNPVKEVLRRRIRKKAASLGANYVINLRWHEVSVPMSYSTCVLV